ncbi:MAG TPA: 3-isopropylmalate dehydratase/homoaconitate hydratase family large subunit [Methanoregulaceae archaeon]|nr:3-isopropylmalate dehydratase/homoaconitate hydratase family large subunit [Methanoregulaceae archaeon]
MSTLSERILKAGAGEYVDRKVDRAYVHDGTGVLTLEAWQAMATGEIYDPERIYVLFDHITPPNNSTTATLQSELRKFASSRGIHFCDVGSGICHQVMGEGNALPWEIIVGADSHTCTLGAFGAFATGVGATDMAAIWASGSTWIRVPETIAINLEGKLQEPAEAKDLALTYVGTLGMDGATYEALEFIGEGCRHLSMDSRQTLCNLVVETGAKNGLFYADSITVRHLGKLGHNVEIQEPEECRYRQEQTFNLENIEPVVAVPPRVDTIRPVYDMAGLHIDQVFVGTCTNGRYDDLFRFARLLKGRKVKVRTIVAPASRDVLFRAVSTGVIGDILKAGCTLLPPGCGPCLGAHMGAIGEGEVCLSTANRNFKNRMGVGGDIYLCSVATAASSAVRGELTEPEG